MLQVLQSLLQLVRFLRIVDGHREQIYEPRQRVLVHWFYISQIRN